jgi:putative ABC transport system substrate-binding protein
MLYSERRRLVALAAKHRLPAMFNAREFVELGGLIAYGASIPDLNRHSAMGDRGPKLFFASRG